MTEKNLNYVLENFLNGICLVVNDSVFRKIGMLEGRMTKGATAVLLVAAFGAVFINLGVIIRIFRLLKKRSEIKPAFFFIGNLAISDFLVGLYVIVVFCVDLSKSSPTWKNKCCGFLTAAVVTACQETICSIVLIAIDKYIFICHGLTYRVKVTRKRVYFVIAFSWFFSLLIGFLPSIGMHEKQWCSCNFVLYISLGFAVILFLTTVAIPLIIIISLYSVILSLAIKMTKSRLKETRSNSSGILTTVVRLSFSSKSSRTTSRSTSKSSSVSGLRRSISRGPKSYKVHRSASGARKDIDTVIAANNFPKISCDSERSITEVTNSIASTSTNGECKYVVVNKTGHRQSSTKSHLTRNESGTVSEEEILSLDGGKNEDKEEDDDSQRKIRGKDLEELNSAVKSVTTKSSYKNKCSTQEENIDYVKEELTENVTKQHNENFENRNSAASSVSEQSIKSQNYFKNILLETKDKVQFLQKCKAVKAIGLIVILFIITYVPFVVGSFVYKMKGEPNEKLFKDLNNLLYCAVVLNSVFNPFVYAYGYQEFRIKTKRFKGIFAKRS